MLNNEVLEVEIGEFVNTLSSTGEWEISTPDGFKPIGDVYLKKNKIKYHIWLETTELICSSDHLLELYYGGYDEEIFDELKKDGKYWVSASEILEGITILTENGPEKVNKIHFYEKGDTYDLEVLSETHRYWSNNISSHNTGKTAIVEGLAKKIATSDVPIELYNKKILSLDLGSLVANSKYRGEFEQRVKTILAELEQNPDIIIFIDEIHTVVGSGAASGSLDVANMIKPALSRSNTGLQIIGATTYDEYRKYIEKDPALERRFQTVKVEAATEEDAIHILNNIKDVYEKHHNVTYTDKAIEACVKLSVKYMPDRNLPDKAIDVIDEVASMIRMETNKDNTNYNLLKQKNKQLEQIIADKHSAVIAQHYERAAQLKEEQNKMKEGIKSLLEKTKKNKSNIVIDVHEIEKAISAMTGIPITKITVKENEKLVKMNNVLKEHIIGQDEAIDEIVKAILRGRLGFKEDDKPILSALLIGSSGVGKTELAKQIAKYLFDNDKSFIRIDMSDFMEKSSITKLQGAAPGYTGYDDNNILSEIRKHPNAVILFDEVEKAHPDIFNIFLQMLDNGVVTDSRGINVSFKNNIILMTSNIGIAKLNQKSSSIGFNSKYKKDDADESYEFILKEVKNTFSPEFINRLDNILYFKPLSEESINKIAEIEINKTKNRCIKTNITFELSDDAKKFIVENGFSAEYGARPLKRFIKSNIDDIIVNYMLLNQTDNQTDIINVKIDLDKELKKLVII